MTTATTTIAPTPTATASSTPPSPPVGALPSPADPTDVGLRIGDDVEHPAFGEGVVSSCVAGARRSRPRSTSPASARSTSRSAFAPLRKIAR